MNKQFLLRILTRFPNKSRGPAVEGLDGELADVSCVNPVPAKIHHVFQRRLAVLLALIAILTVAPPTFGLAAGFTDECFAREGKTPIINKNDISGHARRLFLTPDEMARYVFLTNRRDDGDRSAAVYRARGKKKSLPGNYWVTATLASDSLINHPNASVRRFDAPLPALAANVLHEPWLAVCQQSRTDEEALPSAPTGVFSVTTADGTRLTVVTVSLLNEHSLCFSLLNLSESLIDYAELSASKRPQAAADIEKESWRLLNRVRHRPKK